MRRWALKLNIFQLMGINKMSRKLRQKEIRSTLSLLKASIPSNCSLLIQNKHLVNTYNELWIYFKYIDYYKELKEIQTIICSNSTTTNMLRFCFHLKWALEVQLPKLQWNYNSSNIPVRLTQARGNGYVDDVERFTLVVAFKLRQVEYQYRVYLEKW